MMFSRFLNEGLIKLPHSLLFKAQDFVNYWGLAYLYVQAMRDSGDENERALVMKTIRVLASKLNVMMPTQSDLRKARVSKKIETKYYVKNLPKDYVERVGSVQRVGAKTPDLRNVWVRLIVAFDKHHELPNSEPGCFIKKKDGGEIIISAHNIFFQEANADVVMGGRIDYIKKRFVMAEGWIEHELSHAIQYLILKHLHADQVKHDHADDESYLTSNVEFDPTIKSEAKQLLIRFDEEKAKTRDERKAVMRRFVWDDVPSDRIDGYRGTDKNKRSRFFAALKKSDKARWQKAIKYLMIKVRP